MRVDKTLKNLVCTLLGEGAGLGGKTILHCTDICHLWNSKATKGKKKIVLYNILLLPLLDKKNLITLVIFFFINIYIYLRFLILGSKK